MSKDQRASPYYPFAKDPGETISDWGEVALIHEIRRILGPMTPPPPAGMGDDGAVLPPTPNGEREVVTTDGLVWGRHFDASISPERAGMKLVNRNLSDLAAMGARPAWMVLNLLPGPDCSKAWMQGFVGGLRRAAEAASCPLLGGDIAEGQGQSFAAFITAGGWATRPLERTGARIGDTLWVTGSLGGSLAGRHADFVPRLEEGQWLARHPEVRSCIDLTDGLAKDLPALLPAGAAAALDTERFPFAPEAGTVPGGAPDPLSAAFLDGEDYELLFTLDGTFPVDRLLSEWPFTRSAPLRLLGVIVEAPSGMATPFLDAEGSALSIATEGGYRHLRTPG